jgi:Domain of unknown function (DUF1839)
VRYEILRLDPASYVPNTLHTDGRIWTETNCYVDLWIEVLHALHLDPIAGLAFTLSTDFEGDQWTMFKYPTDDLRRLYGITVAELNVWRDLVHHVAEQFSLGHLLTMDADAWFLPDTQGITYGLGHQKTTIMAQMLDLDQRRLGYFHNAAYFELDGDDFNGLFRLQQYADPSALVPYVEAVRLDGPRVRTPQLADTVAELTGSHLLRRPPTNPLSRFHKQLEADLEWLAREDLETFHRYAFGTCRQCGANAELAATFVDWLQSHHGGSLAPVIRAFQSIAIGAKSLEFGLARRIRGRSFDIEGSFAVMETAWDDAMSGLARRYG